MRCAAGSLLPNTADLLQWEKKRHLAQNVHIGETADRLPGVLFVGHFLHGLEWAGQGNLEQRDLRDPNSAIWRQLAALGGSQKVEGSVKFWHMHDAAQ